MDTIDSIEGIDGQFNSLVDMFIFLLGGVHFLLLFLLAALEIASHPHVRVLAQPQEALLVQAAALRDEPRSLEGKLLEELLVGLCGDVDGGAVEQIQPDPHVVNYIAIYLINFAQIDQLLIQIMLQRVITAVGRVGSVGVRAGRAGFAAGKEEGKGEEKRERREEGQEGEEREQEDEPLREQNRNTVGWWIYRFFFWGGFSLLSYNTYLAYTHNKKTPVQDEPGAIPYVIDAGKAITEQINEMTEMVTQPPLKKLLPDPVHPDFHPKTLVLNLTGTLVKSQYIFGKGNKTVLRPGVENMLQRLVQKYEIIVFADEESALMANALNSVDPRHRFISCLLGKESMVWRSGSYIKDLKYLNRDLRKVIIVDRRKQNVKSQPENLILLSDYDGSSEDVEINKLLALLERLAGPEVVDVRKELTKLGQNPVQTYFQRMKEKQKKLQQKSGVFGIFNGPKKGQKQQKSDDL